MPLPTSHSLRPSKSNNICLQAYANLPYACMAMPIYTISPRLSVTMPWCSPSTLDWYTSECTISIFNIDDDDKECICGYSNCSAILNHTNTRATLLNSTNACMFIDLNGIKKRGYCQVLVPYWHRKGKSKRKEKLEYRNHG